jgi:hypothetical protein
VAGEVRCAWGPRDGMKRVRECVFGGELDLQTLIGGATSRSRCWKPTEVPAMRVTGSRSLYGAANHAADAGVRGQGRRRFMAFFYDKIFACD